LTVYAISNTVYAIVRPLEEYFMIVPSGDKGYISGSLDVILIYHHVDDNTFHPAVYVEAPMSGAIQSTDDLSVVRLRSDMHHAAGFSSLREAQENIRAELQPKLGVPDDNVLLDSPYPWNGEIGHVMVVSNWRRHGAEIPFRDMFIEGVG